MKHGGKDVHLGSFATAEEAALHVARSPEGRKAAERMAAAAAPRRSKKTRQGNPPAMPYRVVLKEEGTVPPMPAGAFFCQGGGGLGPVHAARRLRQGGGRRQAGARGHRRRGWALGGPTQEAKEYVKISASFGLCYSIHLAYVPALHHLVCVNLRTRTSWRVCVVVPCIGAHWP